MRPALSSYLLTLLKLLTDEPGFAPFVVVGEAVTEVTDIDDKDAMLVSEAAWRRDTDRLEILWMDTDAYMCV